MLMNAMTCGHDDKPVDIREPNWEDIKAATTCLDGIDYTQVCVGQFGAEVPHMCIGGGALGNYQGYATYDNLDFHMLLNPEGSPDEHFNMVVGGQSVDVPLNECVSLETALRAVKRFAEDGSLDPSVPWMRNFGQ